ncbi:MAG: phosphoribosylglycinamide formyltransferase [Candidatus Nitrosocaldaceae archaeon]|nr:MAG: phosphoribosylglycinamide formyltransferase [Candidatus Nitrosocaldaceae archaeon]
MINLAILVSGRGSNMEAILKSIKKGEINADPKVVISNKKDARALSIAREYGVPTEFIDDQGKKGVNWEYDKKIVDVLNRYDVTNTNGLICLAGYMKILSPEFIRLYKHRIMNIHPALLPSFPGLNAQKQALEYGVKITGCTVHFADEGVDTGPIIIQRAVEVRDDDTVETLSARILEQEHIAYPLAVKLFAENRLKVEGRRVFIK